MSAKKLVDRCLVQTLLQKQPNFQNPMYRPKSTTTVTPATTTRIHPFLVAQQQRRTDQNKHAKSNSNNPSTLHDSNLVHPNILSASPSKRPKISNSSTVNLRKTPTKMANQPRRELRTTASIGGNRSSEKFSADNLSNLNLGERPMAKYGGRFMVTMLPGDGIGPEMMRHVKTLFKVGGMPVDFEEINLDSMNENIEKVEEAITSIKRNGVALKGNIETREHSKYFKSRNVELRTRLNLYANVVHIKSQPGVKTRHQDLNIVLIRQNTEGEYSSIEHETVTGVVECYKVVTREKSEQIADYAFKFAEKNGRKKVTCVHKANIMKLSDGLFLDVARSVAKSYPNIQFDDIIIDNCSMQLVSNPHQFDVLLLPNLYGAVLTNIACGIAGGPGLISGANFGDEYAVFETGSRNTGKAMAGKNVANPTAVFNAAADLLQHLKLDSYAFMLRNAINKALNEAKIHTPDLNGVHTTTDVVNFIVDEIRHHTSV